MITKQETDPTYLYYIIREKKIKSAVYRPIYVSVKYFVLSGLGLFVTIKSIHLSAYGMSTTFDFQIKTNRSNIVNFQPTQEFASELLIEVVFFEMFKVYVIIEVPART